MHKNNLGEFALKTIFGPIGYSILKETVNAYNTLKDINKELDKGFEKIDKQPTKKITNSSCVQGGYCDLKKQDSKVTKKYNDIKATTKPIGFDWFNGVNDYVKNETSSKANLTKDDIKITAVEKECDLIILNYIFNVKQLSENEKEKLFRKIKMLFPYIEAYKNFKYKLNTYDNFKFEEKVFTNNNGIREMKKEYKNAFKRRIYALYGLLNNNPDKFTEKEFNLLENTIDGVDSIIKAYE